MVAKYRRSEETNARQAIKQLRVVNAANLAEKGKRIAEFVARFQSTMDSGEATRMQRAAELAHRFSESNNYTVKLKQTGGLLSAYQQGVVLYVDDKQVREYWAPGNSKEVTWEVVDTRIQWSAGQARASAHFA